MIRFPRSRNEPLVAVQISARITFAVDSDLLYRQQLARAALPADSIKRLIEEQEVGFQPMRAEEYPIG